LAGYFTKIEVADPRLVSQSIWENLPPSEKALLAELASFGGARCAGSS
jgi:hypothetical protein